MSKVVVINGITLDNANIVPLVKKIETWSRLGYRLKLVGTTKLFHSIILLSKEVKFKKIIVKSYFSGGGKIAFFLNGILNNIQVLGMGIKDSAESSAVYTVSSVLELIVYPFVLKAKNKNIKWLTVFDNTVSISFVSVGAFLVSLVTTFMFKISLLLLKRADTIFAISDQLREYLINKGFSEQQVILSQNGIEVRELSLSHPQKKYQTDAIYVGRINTEKGIYDMLEVLKLVTLKRPKFKLGIIGIGDSVSMARYLQDASNLGLRQNIVFFGKQFGLTKFNIIKSSRSFLFLSHHESFGVALQEATLCGLPAVVYDLPVYNSHQNQRLINRVTVGNYGLAAKKLIKLSQKIHKPISFGAIAKNWSDIAKLEHKYF